MNSFDEFCAGLRAPAHDVEPALDASAARIAVIAGGSERAVFQAAVAVGRRWVAARPSASLQEGPAARIWPFMYPITAVPSSPAVVWIGDMHEAFVNHQGAGTRLVTTHASYLIQAWLDALETSDVLLLATTDRASLQQHAPEVLTKRGPFAEAFVHVVDSTPSATSESSAQGRDSVTDAQGLLMAALRASDAGERLRLCVSALDHGRTAPALLATASACMEVNDLDAAARDLDEALAQAPDWPAAHFERGKLWLRLDDMPRASECFQGAASRMPRFGSAWANLGAALGELDRPSEALAAFEHALACDPASPQALNNIGVVNRELGNLADSEAAFRHVTQLAPDLAFGYYNLGHTLFLQGRYHMALTAYVEGQKRDFERNPVQASRLALCRLASGDADGALVELQRATGPLPRAYKQQLLADTNAIAWALLTHRPGLPGWKRVNDWLAGELASLA